MSPSTERMIIDGPSGPLELALDQPKGAVEGIAVIAHPHPLFGGSLDNKVVQTIARAFLARDMVCVRPNFRGVGQSLGVHDHGQGEQQDLLTAWGWAEKAFGARAGPRRWAGGFSFGASVTTHVAAHWGSTMLAAGRTGNALSACVLVGLAVTRVPPAEIDARSHLIHGSDDEVVPLEPVLKFAQAHRRPVAVLPGASHFFHGMLHELKDMVLDAVARA